MREILFRGKDKDDLKWYEGGYYPYTVTTYCCTEDYALHPENTRHYILFDRMTDWGLPNQHYRAEIIPETLAQYTGLKDKNGKRIFEGDIVRGKDNLEKALEVYGHISHENGSFVIVGEFMTHYRWLDYEVEVIGNIHDNPELLEV